ncbi:MAG: NlpC/P60 family protein [Salinibacterium sp.]|nr:MAG: NlpC/P60 family protein [Salinibacterium sp.]
MRTRSNILSTAVMAIVVPGLFATVALPAYAFAPESDTAEVQASVALRDINEANAQSLVVAATAESPVVARDAFNATTHAELRRAALARQFRFSGPSVGALLAHPPYPNFSLSQVANVAMRYQGVPYVYGGASPSGFDCSGFVMYVYAQFGVRLPHSASGIAASGRPIARSAAVAGDVVSLPGHVGIYLGNGRMIDAPAPGRTVQPRAIYDNNYTIIRIGI